MGLRTVEARANGEAANEFELLAANPNGHLPDIAYGLYRAGKSLSQPQVVRQALALGPSALAPRRCGLSGSRIGP